ncbi:MAG: KpsF/GutQ family sugar-phosphate isomerase [Pseudomonadota bacterium]
MAINIAKKVIEEEAMGLALLAKNIPPDLARLAHSIENIKGKLIVSGIGKSGYIARKIASSFASTGTAAFYMHPAEASHGDLGMITQDDIVMLLSNSGETKEMFDILNYCKRFSIEIAGMTMRPDSTLGKASNYLLNIPVSGEASMIDAPTTSALMMLSLGDALMIAVHEAKGFTKDDFKVFHPGGKLGAMMLKASDLMRTGSALPIIYEDTKMSDALIVITKQGLGCAVVLNLAKKICGIITDGDLRRHMHDDLVNMKASEIMTKNPKTIPLGMLASEVLGKLNASSITSLVVAESGDVKGIVHMHDILKAGV